LVDAELEGVFLRVLIVDDALFMRKVLRSILEDQGHEVVGEAGSSKEAVEQYPRLQPDVVTLDFTLPDLDGLKTLRLLRGYDRGVRAIMITAMGQEWMVKEARSLGAVDFIVKPFDPERVRQALVRAQGDRR
jgi:two-component system chemotaxis response regulator CheY